jgi:two-component system, chemotaxis family, protein-glutamate methylesterase/glutaminase
MKAHRAETCRAHALKCRTNAQHAKSEAGRIKFLNLAQHWDSMANQIDDLEDLQRSLSASIEGLPGQHGGNIGNKLDIVAIGASAGGLAAVSRLMALLPDDLAACVLVVLHRSPDFASHLRYILAQKTKLRVLVPRGGEEVKPGVCFVAPTKHHMAIGPDHRVHLLPDGSYRAHNIDALFCSLARNAGRRTIGVVLSGTLQDGTLGLEALKKAGGVALVQSPEEAEYPGMPKSAIAHDGPVDVIGSVDVLAKQIAIRVGRPRGRSLTSLHRLDNTRLHPT